MRGVSARIHYQYEYIKTTKLLVASTKSIVLCWRKLNPQNNCEDIHKTGGTYWLEQLKLTHFYER